MTLGQGVMTALHNREQRWFSPNTRAVQTRKSLCETETWCSQYQLCNQCMLGKEYWLCCPTEIMLNQMQEFYESGSQSAKNSTVSFTSVIDAYTRKKHYATVVRAGEVILSRIEEHCKSGYQRVKKLGSWLHWCMGNRWRSYHHTMSSITEIF